MSATRQMGPLNTRERDILDILIQLHGEYGPQKHFTGSAIAHIAGPCAGSLAGLTLKGYVYQRSSEEGLVYCATEAGYMLFAGIEGQV